MSFKKCGFNAICSYTVIYLPGYSYGNMPKDNTSVWTGMIGVIQKQEADLSVCEVSITADRSEVMDFTLPLHTAV
jgi:GTP-binding protein EngB required for normal cell division